MITHCRTTCIYNLGIVDMKNNKPSLNNCIAQSHEISQSGGLRLTDKINIKGCANTHAGTLLNYNYIIYPFKHSNLPCMLGIDTCLPHETVSATECFAKNILSYDSCFRTFYSFVINSTFYRSVIPTSS